MNYSYKSHKPKVIILGILSVLLLLSSCMEDRPVRKTFVWDEDVKQLMGTENLYAWLQRAPFDNELKQAERDKLVFTNAKQVFPFMNRYYDKVEELRTGGDLASDTVVFSTTEILYQDSVWGDLFVAATLLYDDREVFLADSYIETGNAMFGGIDAVTDMHRASLYETSVVAKHSKYKTGIYQVSADFRDYLLGFYQQGQLVFEAVVPLLGSDTLASLDKMKEINKSLGLNIPEWEQAKVAQLTHVEKIEKPNSFWQNPFVGIYPGKYTPQVYLKIKDTPFTQSEEPSQGDNHFAYQSDHGHVSFYTSLQKTEMTKEEFNMANKKLNSYSFSYNDIFYTEQSANGYVTGTAKTYFKDHQYVEIHFSYPDKDSKAKESVHSVLKYLNVIAID